MELRTTQDIQTNNVVKNTAKGFAPNGAHFIATTSSNTATGSWYAIAFSQETEISALTASDWTGDSVAGKTFPAGYVIYGTFTGITLTSGECTAYFNPGSKVVS